MLWITNNKILINVLFFYLLYLNSFLALFHFNFNCNKYFSKLTFMLREFFFLIWTLEGIISHNFMSSWRVITV